MLKPALVIAEVGINHNGDIQLALEAIRAAKAAGADAVKFQNYKTEDFISDKSLTYTYISQGCEVVESQFEMFKRCELSDAQVLELASACKYENILFCSTPTNNAGVAVLQRAGAAFLKNGSDYLSHIPLIRDMARSGLPTILSTGMATLGEIEDAITAFREAGGQDLTLLHCTSSYPTPPHDTHLRKIPTLRDAFGFPVGFSDHTEGIVAALGAVMLGACMVEKHFTVDKNLPGPDHGFSMNPGELRALVTGIRTIEAQMGTHVIGPTQSETANRQSCTLSCVACRNLQPGYRLQEKDIAFRRPGNGLRPKYIEWLKGKVLSRSVNAGVPILLEDIS